MLIPLFAALNGEEIFWKRSDYLKGEKIKAGHIGAWTKHLLMPYFQSGITIRPA